MNWNIKGCSPQCTNCKKEWKDKDEYHCLLFLLPQGSRRDDYCVNCWGDGKRENNADSYWKGRFKDVGAGLGPAQPALGEPLLLRILKKWMNKEERLHQCFCYIIALLLERNRYFRKRPSIKKDGHEELVYEDRTTGEAYILEDPNLTLAELTTIETPLLNMLKQELT